MGGQPLETLVSDRNDALSTSASGDLSNCTSEALSTNTPKPPVEFASEEMDTNASKPTRILYAKEHSSIEILGGAEVVQRAYYGDPATLWSSTRGRDVTEEAREILCTQPFLFACNASFGDPVPYTMKVLAVEVLEDSSYDIDDNDVKVCIQAGLRRIWEYSDNFGEADQASLMTYVPLGAHATFCSYRTASFRKLRRHWDMDFTFFEGLCDHPLWGGCSAESGKSGACFWFSEDHRFIIKTINGGELEKLLCILEPYAAHFKTHVDSVLCRLFGAFKLERGGSEILFVVMNNVMCGDDVTIDAIYDLKGTTEDRWVLEKPGAVLKDLNFGENIIALTSQEARDSVLKTIYEDAAFLDSYNIMDYSLLLGVRRLKAGESFQYPTHSCHRSRWAVMKGFIGTENGSTDEPVVYYLGVIDILQDYNNFKLAAHIFKSNVIGWFYEIDTEPPLKYFNRFMSFFDRKIVALSTTDESFKNDESLKDDAGALSSAANVVDNLMNTLDRQIFSGLFGYSKAETP